jgi:hypothetical protein
MTTPPAGARPVLHADFISLAPETPAEAKGELIEAARALATLDDVLSIALIHGAAGSDFELVLLFLLRDFRSLEPFGTHPIYSRFLQGSVAPLLRELAGADIQLEGEFPPLERYAACLGVAGPPQTYDWEVRDLLSRWTDGVAGSTSAVGLALGERQRFRGLAVLTGIGLPAVRPSLEGRFGLTLVSGEAQLLA